MTEHDEKLCILPGKISSSGITIDWKAKTYKGKGQSCYCQGVKNVLEQQKFFHWWTFLERDRKYRGMLSIVTFDFLIFEFDLIYVSVASYVGCDIHSDVSLLTRIVLLWITGTVLCIFLKVV